MFHYTLETKKSVEQTVDSIQASLKSEGFGVLWDFNVKDTLQEKGYELNHTYRILEVCNPGEAKSMIDQNPLVSYFLPCKVVVYEEDGLTKLGMARPTKLIEFINDDKLNDTAKDIEERMIACMNQSI
ncbi:hypothetical protein N781_13160 [Pontibacillus halophilus JSM 076056 = DSM 19796]|uniref:DUF302 domain-containing protein n=1 Tax=Pontibacillus halophilus JSM 076056 = DSM 19796 TaxID=1385510 RepID=A0A0A5GNU2_9BACI|nr:DUF302 domain-containing protein [Pontibacillus halophilus]KGX92840.1 hypothetical protein N781_13160 [Pontibacillus halophilus JSM 076056 = DSM 19796]